MFVFTFVALLAAAQPPDVDIKPDRVWGGVLADERLREIAPQSHVIRDAETFSKVWNAWRPGEKEPEIDFGKSIVLAETIDGPNRMFVMLALDDGDLRPQFGGTKVGGPGFGYLIALVDRDGIKSVNGRPIANDPVLPRPAPDPQPAPDPVPDRPRPPVRDEPDRRRGESIRVTVRGPLETGIVAIGGETTGTVIRSKGLTFEVQLDRPGLRERAAALNGKLAIVAGELVIKEGVEVGPRLIIEADRVDLVPERRRPR